MRKGWLALLILAGALALHPACEVPPLMAPGATVVLFANPGFIVANGGVSVVTALLTEPAGTLVPDGTVVYFFANLGRIDPQAKTRDGLARVNFVSDARSGNALIRAFSGGAPPAPAATGTPVPGDSGVTDAITIVIGSANPTRVVLSAPSSVRAGSSVTLVANVFDASGNPVANVPVVFTITGGSLVSLESGGRQRFTDNNGQTFDELLTRPTSTGPVTVTATTANGIASNVVSITVLM